MFYWQRNLFPNWSTRLKLYCARLLKTLLNMFCFKTFTESEIFWFSQPSDNSTVCDGRKHYVCLPWRQRQFPKSRAVKCPIIQLYLEAGKLKSRAKLEDIPKPGCLWCFSGKVSLPVLLRENHQAQRHDRMSERGTGLWESTLGES